MMRQQSESGMYHIFSRGVGRHTLFEDEEDYQFFRTILRRYSANSVEIHGWCLMPNHYHLLLHSSLSDLARFTARLNTIYATYYNNRHGHVGHVFQGRYGCEPISSEHQLLIAIRYIHRNPIEAGLSTTCDYPWSSYQEYLQGSGITETTLIGSYFPDSTALASFHESSSTEDYRFIDDVAPSLRSRTRPMTDELAVTIEENALGPGWRDAIISLVGEEKTAALRTLKAKGLSIRQIERLTGIGRDIVARA